MKNPALTPPTVDDKYIRRFLLGKKRSWLQSPGCKELLKQAHLFQDLACPVTKIVGFGFRTMVNTHRGMERTRAFQHLAMLTVREMVEEIQGTKNQVQCYAQDPHYEDVEVLALASKSIGIKILPDPEGFLMVDDSTIVMHFFAGIGIGDIVMDLARPVAMVWDGTSLSEEHPEYVLDPKG